MAGTHVCELTRDILGCSTVYIAGQKRDEEGIDLGINEGSTATRGQHQRRSVTAMAVVVVGLAVGAFFTSAGAQEGREPSPEDHVTVLHDGGRFTGPGEWPPAPKSADGPLIAQDAPSISGRSTSAVQTTGTPLVEVAKRMAQRDDIASELGERYSLISAAHPSAPTAEDKLRVDPDRIELVWFSRAHNQSVKVTVSDGEAAAISTLPAAEGQPELSAEEHSLAVELAIEHWRGEIGSRVDDMTGFSIFELRDDGSVHDVRMAYVTLHADARSIPELLTWVDLTNEDIVKARIDR